MGGAGAPGRRRDRGHGGGRRRRHPGAALARAIAAKLACAARITDSCTAEATGLVGRLRRRARGAGHASTRPRCATSRGCAPCRSTTAAAARTAAPRAPRRVRSGAHARASPRSPSSTRSTAAPARLTAAGPERGRLLRRAGRQPVPAVLVLLPGQRHGRGRRGDRAGDPRALERARAADLSPRRLGVAAAAHRPPRLRVGAGELAPRLQLRARRRPAAGAPRWGPSTSPAAATPATCSPRASPTAPRRPSGCA